MCEILENIRQERDIEEIPEAKIDQRSNISQHLLLLSMRMENSWSKRSTFWKFPHVVFLFKHLDWSMVNGCRVEEKGLIEDTSIKIVQIVGQKGFGEYRRQDQHGTDYQDIVPVGTMSSNILKFPGSRGRGQGSREDTTARELQHGLEMKPQLRWPEYEYYEFRRASRRVENCLQHSERPTHRFAPILLKGTPLHWFRNTN
ncbi:hypothetical protein JTB14_037516 [Gonioctena quinquepunctata]|nr:hypothetical protein JTB14_037516 [Gonioctena quinquepunctata]